MNLSGNFLKNMMYVCLMISYLILILQIFFREIPYSTRIYPEGQKVKQEKEFNNDRTQKDKI